MCISVLALVAMGEKIMDIGIYLKRPNQCITNVEKRNYLNSRCCHLYTPGPVTAVIPLPHLVER